MEVRNHVVGQRSEQKYQQMAVEVGKKIEAEVVDVVALAAATGEGLQKFAAGTSHWLYCLEEDIGSGNR